MASAKLLFMARLPKKRGVTQDGEDKSIILGQNVDYLLATRPHELSREFSTFEFLIIRGQLEQDDYQASR